MVEEVIPRSAILVGETYKAEMRDINTSTVRNERSRAAGTGIGLEATAGPSFNFEDPLGGLRPAAPGRADRTVQFATPRTAGLGGTGTSKIGGQLKHQNPPCTWS